MVVARAARGHVPVLANGAGHGSRAPILAVVGLSLVALAYLWQRPGFETFEISASLALACGWVAWQRRGWRRAFSPLGPLALAIGWAIQAGVEMLTVRNDGGRMNTVFKFWYESWIVLAVGCAVVVAEQLRSRDVWSRRTSRLLVARFGGARRRVLVDGNTAAHGRPAERRRVVAGR